MLETAAELSHKSLSDIVRRKAMEAADIGVPTRSTVAMPAKEWNDVEAWRAAPPVALASLRDLARRTPSWDR